MDKNAIKNFSIEARKILMKSAESEAGFYGVTRKGCKNPIQKGNGFEVYETLAGTENRIYGVDIKKRANLVEAVEALGFDQVIEATAYTWFNRIIAIRFMEVNGYLPTRVRVLSSETGSNTPDIVTQSLDVDLNMTSEELEKVQKAKDENRYDDAFRMLFVKQCNELNAILPGLFEKTNDYMELLLKLSYTSDGVVRMLVDTVAEDNFNVETEGQVEIIGWMYQYYNTELKDDTFAKLKKNVKITKERIPAATQLFTPDWIVRYMVENSVGRVWIEHLRAMDSSIDEKAKAEEFGWKYYLPEAEQETEVQEKLVEIRKSYLSLEPKDITCIDPCMGSGHILVYMFDVLMDIYRSEGFSERDAVFSILENNIRGLDIDRRAYQLSYFALMMKARGYNRLFFRGIQNEDGKIRFVEPIVFAIEESNDIKRNQLKYFGVDLNDNEKNNAMSQINQLLDSLRDAKEYGSILNIDNYDWNLLRKFVSKENTDGQISFDTLGIDETKKKISFLIEQSHVMAQEYWVVNTNPPYMSLSNSANTMVNYVNNNYKDYKTDLFTVFIKKCETMLKPNAFQAMITQQAWMFLGSFNKMRNDFLKYIICNMIHLGARAFDEISGEVVQTVAFIRSKKSLLDYDAIYMRITDEKGEEEKKKAFLSQNNTFTKSEKAFLTIPENPIAYWFNRKLVECFGEKKLYDIACTKQGFATGNNDKYLKLWYEVSWESINKKWFPCNKGGTYRKWYGNNNIVANWENNGIEMRKEPGAVIRNPDFYFRKGLTWSSLGNNFGVRYSEEGFLFESKGSMCFVNSNENLLYTLGLLNSSVAKKFLEVLAPTLDFHEGPVSRLPIIIDDTVKGEVEDLVKKNILISKMDWNSNENSWEYKRHPLLKNKGKILGNFTKWKEQVDSNFEELKSNEEKLNNIFVRVFDLKDEVKYTIEDSDLTIGRASVEQDIRSLISYAVGCMFGRYSLDTEGITYAGGEWNLSNYSSYIPDRDGIILISDMKFFNDDIVARFEEFIRIAYGDDYLEENLDFISRVLGNKGTSSRDIIRNYFANDFFKEHCNSYSLSGAGKRPIYWLFDSGKENGFKCLIYMHRYTKDTLNLIRSEYLRKTEDAIENALKNSEYVIQTSSSAVEKAKATKDRDKYVKQLNEMRIYYQALSHLAIQKIEIDLDNGVKNNYQLFQGIEVIVDGGKKQKVDLLSKI